MNDDDVERQPLLQGNTVNVNQNGSSSATSTSAATATTVSPIGPDELPPPYSSVAGGVQMVSCRVCSNMIDIMIGNRNNTNGKRIDTNNMDGNHIHINDIHIDRNGVSQVNRGASLAQARITEVHNRSTATQENLSRASGTKVAS